jgi:DNA-binding CsgD family transcriptional regulator
LLAPLRGATSPEALFEHYPDIAPGLIDADIFSVYSCDPVAEWHRGIRGTSPDAIQPGQSVLVPLQSCGQLFGFLRVGRRTGRSPFSTPDLRSLCAAAAFLSSILVQVSRASGGPRLTPREQEIAALVVKGLTNAEIAAVLGIGIDRVKQALKRMFIKLDVASRTELAVAVGLPL